MGVSNNPRVHVEIERLTEEQSDYLRIERKQGQRPRRNSDIMHKGYEEELQEGEIVDEYDLISDEECNMRRRIKELEARNAELEKIAIISCNYTKRYGFHDRDYAAMYSSERYPLASIDLVNSMDSESAARMSFGAPLMRTVRVSAPKKVKRRKLKTSKGIMHKYRGRESSGDKHRTQRHRYEHKRRGRGKLRNRRSHQVSDREDNERLHDSSERSEASDDSIVYNVASREKLRFALERSTTADKSKGSLRERLSEVIALSCGRHGNKDEMMTKKRRAVVSPNEMVLDDNDGDGDGDGEDDGDADADADADGDGDSSPGLEEQELRLIALKSAIIKKHLARKKRDAEVAYSPTDFEDMLAGSAAINGDEDDMDVTEVEMDGSKVASSMEISPVASPKLHLTFGEEENSGLSASVKGGGQSGDTKPIDMDIAHSDSDTDVMTAYNSGRNQWELEQNALAFRDDHQRAATPSNRDLYSASLPINDFHCSNMNLERPSSTSVVIDIDELSTPSPDGVSSDIIMDDDNLAERKRLVKTEIADDNGGEGDEEEMALRALLLSKISTVKSAYVCRPNNVIGPMKVEPNDASTTPTESILKKAVRRLKMRTCEENNAHSSKKAHMIEKQVAVGAEEEMATTTTTKSPMKMHEEAAALQVIADKLLFFDGNAVKIEPDAEVKKSDRTKGVSAPKAMTKSDNPILDLIKERLSCENKRKSAAKVNEMAKRCLKETTTTGEDEDKGESKLIPKAFAPKRRTSTRRGAVREKEEECNETKTIAIANNTEESFEKVTSMVVVMDEAKETNDVPTLMMDAGEKMLEKMPQSEVTVAVAAEKEKAMPLPLTIPPPPSVIPATSPTLTATSLPAIACKTRFRHQNKYTNKNIVLKVASTAAASPVSVKKIIKPHKIINYPAGIKRKPAAAENSLKCEPSTTTITTMTTTTTTAAAAATITTMTTPSSVAAPSRYITTRPVVRVKELVITQPPSDTESLDEEQTSPTSAVAAAVAAAAAATAAEAPTSDADTTLDAWPANIIKIDYDIKSPSSLQMCSPYQVSNELLSPNPGQRTATELPPTGRIISDSFERELDSFLKTVRSQVQQTNVSDGVDTKKIANVNSATVNAIETPVALCHLPPDAQEEYKMLIQRMMLLEKMKQHKTAGSCDDDGVRLLRTMKEQQALAVKKISTPAIAMATTTTKTTTMTTMPMMTTKQQHNAMRTMMPKKAAMARLRSFELSFARASENIMTSLNQLLTMVEEVKQSKIAKLRYQKRLDDLQAETELVQEKLKAEKRKIGAIYPQICSSNDAVTSLKRRQLKILRATKMFGRNVEGRDYRLNNCLKEAISKKCARLAAEIKFVNAMQYGDVKENWTNDDDDDDGAIVLDGNNQHAPTSITTTTTIATTTMTTIPTTDVLDASADVNVNDNMSDVEAKTVADGSGDGRRASLDVEKRETLLLVNEVVSDDIPCSEGDDHDHDHDDDDDDDSGQPDDRQEMMMTVHETVLSEAANGVDANDEIVPRKYMGDGINTKDIIKDNSDDVEQKSLREYISPLSLTESAIDPHAVICPYDLLGRCIDKKCAFMHLTALGYQ